MMKNTELRELILANINNRKNEESLKTIELSTFDCLLNENRSNICFPNYSHIVYNLDYLIEVCKYIRRYNKCYYHDNCENVINIEHQVANWMLKLKNKDGRFAELIDNLLDGQEEKWLEIIIGEYAGKTLLDEGLNTVSKFVCKFDNLIDEIGFENLFDFTEENDIKFEQDYIKDLKTYLTNKIANYQTLLNELE